ncbi:adhesion G-protein coupled receptor G4-like [Anneissia japonica]|uniref:adhesion G-protein coupled receptor G4-like n=1 Tax=Anneissia japonica TaxID=1529436 RepID=UPI0014258B5F|nr:adhesion G-protein coupled receptor G4-like [Anneissia japonica]
MLYVIILLMCNLHMTCQQISRDHACDLSTDAETVIIPTTVKYTFPFSASTISPRILYNDVGEQFTNYAEKFNEEVGPYLAQEESLGLSDVTTIRFRQSADRSDFALVDFIVSCEENVTYDVINAAMMNVAEKTDYIDLSSLEVNKHVIYCLRQEFETKVGTFTWPVTLEGSTVTTEESCSEDSVNGVEFKLAVRQCVQSDNGAYWDSFQCTDCGGASASYLLRQLFSSLPNGDSVEELMKQVANITEMTESIRVDGLEAAVNIIEYIVQESPVLTVELVNELVRTVHNIQQLPSKTVTDAQGSYSTSSRLLQALHSVLMSMKINPNVPFTSFQDSIIVLINEEDTPETALAWYQFGILGNPSDSDSLTAGGFSANANEPTPIPIGNTMIYLQNMPDMPGNTRKTFLLHQNDVLFRSPSDELRLSSKSSKFIREINTRIITTLATSNNTGVPKISAYFQPIKVKNRTLNKDCQTWDWSKDEGKGGWTEEGCTISEEGQYIHCTCNSYSSFAVAMDVYGIPITVYHKYTISRVGSAIATILLLLTVLIFVCLKDLRNSKPHQILAHLFSALAIWHLFFTVGIDLTSNREVCATFGILMHYGILVSLSWMIVGAIDIYIVFVTARALPIKSFVLKSSVLAWGIPLVIVIIVAAIDLDSYIEKDQHCFIVKSPALVFIISMIVPVFAAVCSISIVYFMACNMSVPLIDGKIEDEGDPMFRKRQQARVLVIASSVIVILGILTVIFGFIAIFSATTGTDGLFFLFSILEGSAIFGTCCVWPSEVRHLWLKKLGVLKKNPTKQGVFQPYWSLSKWTSKSVLPEAEPQFFLDNTMQGNGIITPQNIVLETFAMPDISNNTLRESTA